ncbi:MAG: hypothetical protein J6D26_05405 [Clostridia bacterium]|nr:hypothetical protein [Clostridia bacterium]
MKRTKKKTGKILSLIVCIAMLMTFLSSYRVLAEYDGVAVGNATEMLQDGSYTVSINMKNNSAAEAQAILVAAVYQNNSLYSVKSHSRIIPAEQSADFSASAELPESGSYTYKYFTWNSLDDLKPFVNGLPTDVENTIVKTTGNTCAYITWDVAEDDYAVASYNVYRDGALVGNSDTTCFYDAGLEDGEEYIYRVFAVDNKGKESENALKCYARTSDNYAIDFGINKADSAPYWSNGPISVPAQEISNGTVESTTYEGVNCVKLGSSSKIYFKLPAFINNGDGTKIQMIITYYEPASAKNLNLQYSYYNADGTSVGENPTQSMSIGSKDIDRNRWRTQVVTLENSAYGIYWDSKTDRDFRINNQTGLDIYIANVAFVKDNTLRAAVLDANSSCNASNNIIQTSVRTITNINGVNAYDICREESTAPKLDVRTTKGYFSDNTSVRARVGITYYDAVPVEGNGNRLFVQYMSGDNEATADLPFVNYTGSEEWKTAYFDIDDLYTGEGSEWMIRVNSTGIAVGEHMYVSKISIVDTDYTYRAENPTIFLAGDSTMQNYTAASPNTYGWGGKLADYLTDSVNVTNYALGGQNTSEYLDGVSISDDNLIISTTDTNWRIEKILSQSNYGDYVFVQFGHNDLGDGITTSVYKENLERFVTYVQRYGVKPVFLTSIPKHQFESEYVWSEDEIEPYRTVMKETAEELGIPVIDIASEMVALFQKQGQTATASMYNIANDDNVHLVEAGAASTAKLVAKYLDNYTGDNVILNELKAYVDSSSLQDAELTAPENLTVTAEKATSITLSWDSVDGALSYNVYRGNDCVATVSQTTYKDANLNSGTAYTYTVSAVNDSSESEKSSAVTGTTRVVASLEFNLDTIRFTSDEAGYFTGNLISVNQSNSIDATSDVDGNLIYGFDTKNKVITLGTLKAEDAVTEVPCVLINNSGGTAKMQFTLDETVTASKGENDDNLWVVITYYTENGSGAKSGKIEYVNSDNTSTDVKLPLNSGWNTVAFELEGTSQGISYNNSVNNFRINPQDAGVSMYISKIEVTRGYEAGQ